MIQLSGRRAWAVSLCAFAGCCSALRSTTLTENCTFEGLVSAWRGLILIERSRANTPTASDSSFEMASSYGPKCRSWMSLCPCWY